MMGDSKIRGPRTEVGGHVGALLIWTGGSTPLLCLEGVPDFPVAPQDEAGAATS